MLCSSLRPFLPVESVYGIATGALDEERRGALRARTRANLFFQLVSRRYERGRSFSRATKASAPGAMSWGDSYRLKEKMKAGLLKSKIATAVATE
jgi:hypothetical protein